MTKDDLNLKDSLKDYVKVILGFLTDNAPEYYKLEDLVSKLIPGIVAFEEEKEAQIPIYQLPEARKFKELMKAHPIVGRHFDVAVGTEISLERLGVWSVFQKFMLFLISIQRNLLYDAKAFEKAFKSMMSFFKSNTISVQFIAMLENFNFFNDDDIILDNGWHLKRISKVLYDDLIGIIGYDQLLPQYAYETRHALVNEFTMKKIIVGPGDKRERALRIYDQVNDEIDTIMSAFRLVKKGRIIRRMIDTQIIGWHPFRTRENTSNLIDAFEPGNQYAFSEEDIGSLNRLLDLLSYAKSDKTFQIPLRRLKFSTERKYAIPEDRILDGMIAFDSLFGADRELSYQLSLRVAMFLGETSKKRLSLKKDLASAYNLRSRIIHGNKPKQVRKALKDWDIISVQKTDTLEDLLGHAADEIEDLLRQTLIKYLNELKTGKNNDIIIDEIEGMILNDASISLLDAERIPESSIIDYLISLGGTPKKVVELLIEREICAKEE